MDQSSNDIFFHKLLIYGTINEFADDTTTSITTDMYAIRQEKDRIYFCIMQNCSRVIRTFYTLLMRFIFK